MASQVCDRHWHIYTSVSFREDLAVLDTLVVVNEHTKVRPYV